MSRKLNRLRKNKTNLKKSFKEVFDNIESYILSYTLYLSSWIPDELN